MKIEYFPDSQDGPAVLLYGHEREGFLSLKDAATRLSNESTARIAVHELPGFQSVDECQLFFSISTHHDYGVNLPSRRTYMLGRTRALDITRRNQSTEVTLKSLRYGD